MHIFTPDEATPGEWQATRILVDNAPDRMIVREARWGGKTIADCGTFAECNPADVRLMAASKDLYAACKAMLEAYAPKANFNELDHLHSAVRAAFTAIAKAGGKE